MRIRNAMLHPGTMTLFMTYFNFHSCEHLLFFCDLEAEGNGMALSRPLHYEAFARQRRTWGHSRFWSKDESFCYIPFLGRSLKLAHLDI